MRWFDSVLPPVVKQSSIWQRRTQPGQTFWSLILLPRQKQRLGVCIWLTKPSSLRKKYLTIMCFALSPCILYTATNASASQKNICTTGGGGAAHLKLVVLVPKPYRTLTILLLYFKLNYFLIVICDFFILYVPFYRQDTNYKLGDWYRKCWQVLRVQRRKMIACVYFAWPVVD